MCFAAETSRGLILSFWTFDFILFFVPGILYFLYVVVVVG